MKVALYIRVSTEEQRIHGLSVQAQREALDAWAEANHAHVVGHYIDAGISARKKASKRPELQRLLADVRDGRIELVVFTKLDRWFRNVSEYYKVQDILESNGVNWRTIHEDYDTSTASGRLKINIMLSVAQDEADRTGERIQAVHASKVLRGEPISGKVPLGYRIENKRMVPDEKTMPIAQDIFKEYVALKSIRALRKYVLDTHGITYAFTSLSMLLQNERYIGKAHGQDDFCEPIIDFETFKLVQSIIAQRAQRNASARSDRVYLFTGIVFCAECGNRLSAHVVDQKYIYYRCTRYEKLHLCPHKKRTSERILEQWLLANLVARVTEHNAEIARPTATVKVDTARIKAKMEKLKDLYLNDLIERDTYERDYTALRAELEAVEPERPPQPIALPPIQDAISIYHALSREKQREFWTRTVKAITITNEDTFSLTLI